MKLQYCCMNRPLCISLIIFSCFQSFSFNPIRTLPIFSFCVCLGKEHRSSTIHVAKWYCSSSLNQYFLMLYTLQAFLTLRYFDAPLSNISNQLVNFGIYISVDSSTHHMLAQLVYITLMQVFMPFVCNPSNLHFSPICHNLTLHFYLIKIIVDA